MRARLVLRQKLAATIIQYLMIEIHDSAGRLIVVLAMRIRHAGRLACVFVDGKMVAEFPSVGEAARHARSLAQRRYEELSGSPCDD
jgi:hypothetical protein